MELIDWLEMFQNVSSRGEDALKWRLPEPWVHAELFAAISDQAEATGWAPFSIEVPYVTFYPVISPGKGHSNWREQGAIKYVDLCIHNQAEGSWCWFEFKVRHAGKSNRAEQAANEARDAFCKDTVALLGFDPVRTGATWAAPDNYTKAYWMTEELRPHAGSLATETHCLVSAFLLLNGRLSPSIWGPDPLLRRLQSWFKIRQKVSGFKTDRGLPPISISSYPLNGEHEVLICEWTNQE